LKLKNKLKIDIEIGDDENEIIVINPKWKKTINLNAYKMKIYKILDLI
jgi:hypothetical protein